MQYYLNASKTSKSKERVQFKNGYIHKSFTPRATNSIYLLVSNIAEVVSVCVCAVAMCVPVKGRHFSWILPRNVVSVEGELGWIYTELLIFKQVYYPSYEKTLKK